MTTLQAALHSARRRLREAGTADADLEAEVLLRHTLDFDRASLYRRLEEDIDPDAACRFEALVQRRLNHEPSAYITGRREFYGLDFAVTPATLIPRPETELLVDAAIELAKHLPAVHPEPVEGRLVIFNVGTGSGAIAVSLARALPEAIVYASDLSPDALAVAATNAACHGVSDRVRFLQADLLDRLPAPADLIVANLPYVKTTDYALLAPELRNYEPRGALDGGSDGLDLIRRLLDQAPEKLRPDGGVCLEFGVGQEEALLALAGAPFPNATFEVRRDLAGLARVLTIATSLQ